MAVAKVSNLAEFLSRRIGPRGPWGNKVENILIVYSLPLSPMLFYAYRLLYDSSFLHPRCRGAQKRASKPGKKQQVDAGLRSPLTSAEEVYSQVQGCVQTLHYLLFFTVSCQDLL